jgi:hypothetical protein
MAHDSADRASREAAGYWALTALGLLWRVVRPWMRSAADSTLAVSTRNNAWARLPLGDAGLPAHGQFTANDVRPPNNPAVKVFSSG